MLALHVVEEKQIMKLRKNRAVDREWQLFRAEWTNAEGAPHVTSLGLKIRHSD